MRKLGTNQDFDTLNVVPRLALWRQTCVRQRTYKHFSVRRRWTKQGNVDLKWAFSEAAVLFLRHTADGKKLLARLQRKHGKGKALSILAHKIGRAVYYILARGTVFSPERSCTREEPSG